MMDDVLINLAKNPPEAREDLSAAGLSEKQIRLWGEMVLTATRQGAQAPLVERRQAERKNDAVLKRLEKLKAWRKKLGTAMQVESDIILPKQYLAALSENPPKDADELKEMMKDAPARFEMFGAQILKTLGAKHAN
jgi:ribonuclease D